MIPPDPAVDDAARAVLDGTAVDWEDLASSPTPSTRAIAEQLKILSAVARTHRALAVDEGPAKATPPPIGQSWGHLQIHERIGAGAFGTVYRAWDTRLERDVALKLLPTASGGVSPILREGQLLARMRNPHVATIYGAELIDGCVGLWMELVRGRTLAELLAGGHSFSVPELVTIGRDLSEAVGAVHAAGLLHRDIKAQNVMREDAGRLVLMDFGSGWDGIAAHTHAAGTPLYLAPEVLAGGPATIQSDIYSLGVLLYHLLTGSYPIDATTLEDLRRAHATGRRVGLKQARPDLPGRLARIVDRATAPDPRDRYGSCEALRSDLTTVSSRSSTRGHAVTVAALVLAVVGAALVWHARASREPAGGFAGATPGTTSRPSPNGTPVIAVLPFRNLSREPESDLVVDGLTVELIRNLALVSGLQVKSATSSFAVRNAGSDLRQIGRELGTNVVVEGSVSRSGGRWRVIAQLARVDGDRPLWSGKFERDGASVFGMQEEVARAVVNHLRLALDAGQRRYDLDPELSSLYLRARALIERRGTTATVSAALPLLEQIIARDPSFAPAYAGLADAYSLMAQDLPDIGGLDPERAIALMRPLVARALELDPLLAEAYAARGFLRARENAWVDAERDFKRAIELNPSLTHAYTTFAMTTLLPAGRFAEAEHLLADALARDPLSGSALTTLAFSQTNQHRYDEAIANLRKARVMGGSAEFVDLLLARAQSFGGHISEAMPYWDSVKGSVGFQHWMAYAYVQTGRRNEVERLARTHDHPYRLAIMYAALGDRDRALDALSRAAAQVPHRVVQLLTCPEMDPLRDDPRFDAIRRRFGLPAASRGQE